MKNNNSGFGAVVVIILGLIFLLGPAFLPKEVISAGSAWLISLFGIVLLVIGAILWILMKLYVKTPANIAFIRTGMGTRKIIIDGGAIVIPIFHELREVSLETMKLIVSRIGKESIITSNSIRADLTAEFYIKIPKTPEGVINAATSLGDKGLNQERIKELVEEKLISALRSVGAKSSLEELHKDRENFATSVFDQVKSDLEKNGLELESVTISKLDQTPISAYDENNVFDVEGARTVSEITSKLKVEKNAFEKKAEQEVGKENLETQKILDNQKVEQEESAAERNKNITVLQASKIREATEKAEDERQKSEAARILADQKIGEIEATKEKAIQTANVEAEKEIELKKIEKNKLIAVQEQMQEQASETARVEKEKTILSKNKEKAVVETEKAVAEAKAAEANQAVITVNKVAEADRSKKVTIVNQEAVAETTKINKNIETDIKAYEVVKTAEADKEAAKNSAEAVTVKAEADLKAKKFEAEGETAVKMVPVNVAKAQVDVNAEQVEVTGKELKYKAEFSQVSITLETNLASINAEKEVGIAAATALGVAFSNANMNIWGDGNTANQMIKMFTEGQGTHFKLKALGNGGDPKHEAKEEAKQLVISYLAGTKTAMEVMGAADNVSAEVKSLVQDFVKSGGGNTMAGIALMVQSLTGKEATTDELAKLEKIVTKFIEQEKK